MELSLHLPPADAAKLHRLPVVRDARAGRSRSAAVRIVWHDSLDRALAARGLALAEQRGAWRLERHRPEPADPWPPATDHKLIEEAAGPNAFKHTLPEALTPVAAFEGRRGIFPLTVEGETVTLTLLSGIVRAVAAERASTRLVLEGPDAAVRALVLSLAKDLELSVPEHSLAEEALSLADGAAPPPRRSGAPELPHDGLSVHAAFAHIIGHLAGVLLHLAPIAADPATGPAPVHQMRVAVRRARSALALFPPIADSPPAASMLKQLGHMLGPARDWDVFMTETAPPVEAVLGKQAPLAALLRGGARRRRTARISLGEYLTGPAFRSLCLELACLAAAQPADTEAEPKPLTEFAAAILQARWKKLSNTGKSLEDLDDPGLHGLRLKAKRLRYAAEFFAPLFAEKPTVRFIRRLSVLQEQLGLFNDTTVAETLLRELSASPGYAAGLVLGFTAVRGSRARPKIAAAWSRFRRREPFWE